MSSPDYEDIAFNERAHDPSDLEDEARYLVQRDGTALTVEVHQGDIDAGGQLLDGAQLFDYMDEFLDRGGRVRMERRS